MVFEKKKIQAMLELQASFNAKLRPDWMTNPPCYTDAIWTEAAEAFNHTNWPWWKKAGSVPDIPQIKMELIDIWHFLMSELLLHKENEEINHLKLVEIIGDDMEKVRDKNKVFGIEDIRQAFRNIVAVSLVPPEPKRIVVLLSVFIQAMITLGMDWNEVYKLYVGKNTLNSFRQANGYKKDTDEYRAIWATGKGWEDNEYLTQLLNLIIIDDISLEELQKTILDGMQAAFDEAKSLRAAP